MTDVFAVLTEIPDRPKHGQQDVWIESIWSTREAAEKAAAQWMRTAPIGSEVDVVAYELDRIEGAYV